MNNKPIRELHLTLKKKHFDDIESGIKKEEYREFKQHWISRVYDDIQPNSCIGKMVPKEFDVVVFHNGYAKNAPLMRVEWKGTDFRPNFTSAIGTMDTIVIMLGDVIEVVR
jgi:hypothetical protein